MSASDLPMILGLDIATNTGAAFGRVGEAPRFSSMMFKGEDTDLMGVAEAVAKAQVWMVETIRAVQPDLVVIEAPMERTPEQGTARTTIKLCGLALAVAGIAINKSRMTRFVTVRAVRRTFLGPGGGNLSGKDGKREVLRFCRAAGWEPNNDNEADAGAVWWWGGRELHPQRAQPMDPVSLRIPPLGPAGLVVNKGRRGK